MPEMQQKDDRIELNPPSFTQYHYLFAHIQQKSHSFLSGYLVGLNGLEPSTFTMSRPKMTGLNDENGIQASLFAGLYGGKRSLFLLIRGTLFCLKQVRAI